MSEYWIPTSMSDEERAVHVEIMNQIRAESPTGRLINDAYSRSGYVDQESDALPQAAPRGGMVLTRGGKATHVHVNGYVETLNVRAARHAEPCHAVGCAVVIRPGELRGRNRQGYYSICGAHLEPMPDAEVARRRAEYQAISEVHEAALAQHLDGARIGYTRQVALGHWRWDFGLWGRPDTGMIALLVDIQGSTAAGRRGAHTSPAGYDNDCRKWATAQLAGRRVLIVTGAMVQSGEALQMIEAALGGQDGGGA